MSFSFGLTNALTQQDINKFPLWLQGLEKNRRYINENQEHIENGPFVFDIDVDIEKISNDSNGLSVFITLIVNGKRSTSSMMRTTYEMGCNAAIDLLDQLYTINSSIRNSAIASSFRKIRLIYRNQVLSTNTLWVEVPPKQLYDQAPAIFINTRNTPLQRYDSTGDALYILKENVAVDKGLILRLGQDATSGITYFYAAITDAFGAVVRSVEMPVSYSSSLGVSYMYTYLQNKDALYKLQESNEPVELHMLSADEINAQIEKILKPKKKKPLAPKIYGGSMELDYREVNRILNTQVPSINSSHREVTSYRYEPQSRRWQEATQGTPIHVDVDRHLYRNVNVIDDVLPNALANRLFTNDDN